MQSALKKASTGLTCLMFAFLTGCASSPYLQDATTYPERVDLEDDNEKLKLSYLAQDMMESDDRRELLSEITKTPAYQRWTSADTAIATQMATDLAVGQLASSTGNVVGNTVYVASLILGEINDGSIDHIGQAFLPESVYGETLDTPEKAQQALVTFTRKQMEAIAQEMGWEYQCVHGCDTWNQIFTFTPNAPLSEAYIYRPEVIVAKTIITLPEPVDPQDPISAMVGFPVKWKTKQGNYYIVDFFSEPILDENMEMELYEHKEYPHIYPGVKRDLASTHIGRELKRKFHSTPYTLYGNQDMYPKLFFYNGEVYSFISNSDSRMIDMVVVEETNAIE